MVGLMDAIEDKNEMGVIFSPSIHFIFHMHCLLINMARYYGNG